jgi:hypothetical protein
LSEFKATKKTSGGGKAVWSAKSGNEFVADPNGDVGVLTSGTYVAALQTPHSTSSHEENIILVRGGKRMLLKTILHNPNGSNEDDCYDYDDAYEDYDYEDRKSSPSGFAAMLFVLELRDGDLFAFKACSFRMKAGAKMVIAKLACRWQLDPRGGFAVHQQQGKMSTSWMRTLLLSSFDQPSLMLKIHDPSGVAWPYMTESISIFALRFVGTDSLPTMYPSWGMLAWENDEKRADLCEERGWTSDSDCPTFQLAATQFSISIARAFTTVLIRRIVGLMSPTTLELDGLTSFRSRPKSSFRFVLTLKGNKLNAWLENRKSKKQW